MILENEKKTAVSQDWTHKKEKLSEDVDHEIEAVLSEFELLYYISFLFSTWYVFFSNCQNHDGNSYCKIGK